MKEISLTRGLLALVDDEDFEELNKYNWCAFKGTHDRTYYAVRSIRKPYKGNLWMHRVILNVPQGKYTDHIDGNAR